MSVAMGRYNVGGGNSISWVETDPLFEIGIGTSFSDRANALTVLKNGNVGIGTSNPTHKLTVKGNIHAREILVTATAGADFVFEEDYELKSLGELERFIIENKHLPDIAPAEEMIENGISINELQIKLLQKVEELTLYVIELKKENEKVNAKLEKLTKESEL